MLQTKAKVLKNIEVTANYYKIILSCPRVARRVQPGQFLQVKVNDGEEPLLRRPFSIHRIVQSSKFKVHRMGTCDQIGILYEVLGKGTEILSGKKPGEYLDVIGPLGQGFDYKSQVTGHRSQVLVAGGMGVAPLVFLAEKLTELKTQNSKLKTIVLIGAKTRNQILCEKEFQKLGCEVKIATDDGSRGFRGKVTDLLQDILRNTHDAIRNTHIYACGPRPMLKEIAKISQQYSIPAQVSLEEHMACGIGACLGCVVKTQYAQRTTQYGFQYKRVCKEGPVFNADEIVWSNEDNRHRALADIG